MASGRRRKYQNLTASAFLRNPLEHAFNGTRIAAPVCSVGTQAITAGRRQRVVPGPTVVLGLPPLRLDEVLPIETVQRLVKRGIFDREIPLGSPMEQRRDPIAVLAAGDQRPQDKRVERACMRAKGRDAMSSP